MQPYNQPDSDINEEEVTLQVRCPECQQAHTMVICKESLEGYADNGDGTYTDILEPWCASCLSEVDGETKGESFDEWAIRQPMIREDAINEVTWLQENFPEWFS